MLYRLGIMIALAIWAAPLGAQVGLATGRTTIALSATKATSLGVSLPEVRMGGPREFTPVIATRWDLDPRRTAAVALVALVDRSAQVDGQAPAGGSKRFTPLDGFAVVAERLVMFRQPIAPVNAAGRRTDALHLTMDPTGTLRLLVITQ